MEDLRRFRRRGRAPATEDEWYIPYRPPNAPISSSDSIYASRSTPSPTKVGGHGNGRGSGSFATGGPGALLSALSGPLKRPSMSTNKSGVMAPEARIGSITKSASMASLQPGRGGLSLHQPAHQSQHDYTQASTTSESRRAQLQRQPQYGLASSTSVPSGLVADKMLFSPLGRELRSSYNNEGNGFVMDRYIQEQRIREQEWEQEQQQRQGGAESAGVGGDRGRSRTRTVTEPRSEGHRWTAKTFCDTYVLPRPRIKPHTLTPPQSPENEVVHGSTPQHLGGGWLSTAPGPSVRSAEIPPSAYRQSNSAFYTDEHQSTSPDLDRVLTLGRERHAEREEWADVVRRRGRSLSFGKKSPPLTAPPIGSVRARSLERERALSRNGSVSSTRSRPSLSRKGSRASSRQGAQRQGQSGGRRRTGSLSTIFNSRNNQSSMVIQHGAAGYAGSCHSLSQSPTTNRPVYTRLPTAAVGSSFGFIGSSSSSRSQYNTMPHSSSQPILSQSLFDADPFAPAYASGGSSGGLPPQVGDQRSSEHRHRTHQQARSDPDLLGSIYPLPSQPQPQTPATARPKGLPRTLQFQNQPQTGSSGRKNGMPGDNEIVVIGASPTVATALTVGGRRPTGDEIESDGIVPVRTLSETQALQQQLVTAQSQAQAIAYNTFAPDINKPLPGTPASLRNQSHQFSPSPSTPYLTGDDFQPAMTMPELISQQTASPVPITSTSVAEGVSDESTIISPVPARPDSSVYSSDSPSPAHARSILAKQHQRAITKRAFQTQLPLFLNGRPGSTNTSGKSDTSSQRSSGQNQHQRQQNPPLSPLSASAIQTTFPRFTSPAADTRCRSASVGTASPATQAWSSFSSNIPGLMVTGPSQMNLTTIATETSTMASPTRPAPQLPVATMQMNTNVTAPSISPCASVLAAEPTLAYLSGSISSTLSTPPLPEAIPDSSQISGSRVPSTLRPLAAVPTLTSMSSSDSLRPPAELQGQVQSKGTLSQSLNTKTPASRPMITSTPSTQSGTSVYTDASEGWERGVVIDRKIEVPAETPVVERPRRHGSGSGVLGMGLGLSSVATPELRHGDPFTQLPVRQFSPVVSEVSTPRQSVDDRDFQGLFFRTPHDPSSPENIIAPRTTFLSHIPRPFPGFSNEPVGLGYGGIERDTNTGTPCPQPSIPFNIPSNPTSSTSTSASIADPLSQQATINTSNARTRDSARRVPRHPSESRSDATFEIATPIVIESNRVPPPTVIPDFDQTTLTARRDSVGSITQALGSISAAVEQGGIGKVDKNNRPGNTGKGLSSGDEAGLNTANSQRSSGESYHIDLGSLVRRVENRPEPPALPVRLSRVASGKVSQAMTTDDESIWRRSTDDDLTPTATNHINGSGGSRSAATIFSNFGVYTMAAVRPDQDGDDKPISPIVRKHRSFTADVDIAIATPASQSTSTDPQLSPTTFGVSATEDLEAEKVSEIDLNSPAGENSGHDNLVPPRAPFVTNSSLASPNANPSLPNLIATPSTRNTSTPTREITIIANAVHSLPALESTSHFLTPTTTTHLPSPKTPQNHHLPVASSPKFLPSLSSSSYCPIAQLSPPTPASDALGRRRSSATISFIHEFPSPPAAETAVRSGITVPTTATSEVAKTHASAFGQLVTGPPGAGKSTYAHGMHQFLTALGRPVLIVNLDPAVPNPPYPCALSITDLITLDEIMETHGLGPNGAMLYAVEYLEANFDWLVEQLDRLLESYNGNGYVIFDTPGQVELWTNHDSLKRIIERLMKMEYRLAAVHLSDAHYITDASKYISVVLLALRAMLQLEMPHVNVLSKMDLLSSYGELPFNLDYYTEVQDLSYLVARLANEPGPRSKRMIKLNEAMCELIEDFSLVGFETLAVEDKVSMMKLLRILDKVTGYIFVPHPGLDSGLTDSEDSNTQGGEAMTTAENLHALFSSASGLVPGAGGDVSDVQERWIDRKEEYDEAEREAWRIEWEERLRGGPSVAVKDKREE